MRVVVVGVGAIGGVIAGALTKSGQEVVGVARGDRYQAICENGLVFRTPKGTTRPRLQCVRSPQEIKVRTDDAVLLCVKGQDTVKALEELRAAGFYEQPIFCTQNGIANEGMALRVFPNVHGINVMMPADYVKAEDVVAYGSPNYGIFDIGRYPNGADEADNRLADALTASGIASFVSTRVMRNKYGKLIQNLGNIVDAALGKGPKAQIIANILREEGRATLDEAGISWVDVGPSDPRREMLMKAVSVPGSKRVGSSSTQSLFRGAKRLETDFLNGEIVLTARLRGEHAPANAFACKVAVTMVAGRMQPGSFPIDTFSRGVGL